MVHKIAFVICRCARFVVKHHALVTVQDKRLGGASGPCFTVLQRSIPYYSASSTRNIVTPTVHSTTGLRCFLDSRHNMGSVVLPHLVTGWHVDQAIMSEEERLVVIRFGRDWDPDCMRQDEVLYRQ